MSLETGLAVVDDSDPTIHYSSPAWLQGKGDRLFGGTCKFSKVAGEYATFTFSGTSVTVYGSIFTIANSTMTFQLDNGKETSYNTTASSMPAFAHHQVFWQSPKLNDTVHTLLLMQRTSLTDGEDTVICPDFFTYVPSKDAVTASTNFLLDDQDSRVTYNGGWTVSLRERSELMMQTGMFTEVPDSTFELEFEGIGIEVYGAVFHNKTATVRAELALDGGGTTTFAPPEPTADVYNQQIFQARNLAHTSHKLTGTLKNSGLLIIDYFLIQPGDPNLNSTISNPSETHNGKKTPTGAIAGGVIGGLALVLILFMGFWWWRRKKYLESQRELETVGADTITPYPANTSSNTDSNTLSPLQMEEVERHRSFFRQRSQKALQEANLELAFAQVPVYINASGSESTGTYSTYSPYSPNSQLSPLRLGDVGRHNLSNQPLTEHVDSGLRFRDGISLPPPQYTQD
ncbi:hypothetical protein L218DRAFT_940384 [Marasmius fiardii PR-910]|nr:hypothetical protein L218DRAFT_940384 [Marasmius fiardii PR-910]